MKLFDISPAHYDVAPLLCGLIPNPNVQIEALKYAAKLQSPRGQLEGFLKTLATFANQRDVRALRELPNITAHDAALCALADAASGLYVLLETSTPEEGWETLGAVRLWALDKGAQLSRRVPLETRMAFTEARFQGPEALAQQVPAVELAVGTVMTGMFAAWDAVGYLLHLTPDLTEDGATDLFNTVLLGLAPSGAATVAQN